MQYIIYDLEATCDERGGWDHETIEIGAVRIGADGVTIDMADMYIKPITNPTLTPFCTKLTGITQEIVDAGIPFPDAFAAFVEWGGLKDTVYCSWGYYDRKQLYRDCERHGIDFPAEFRHISLKHQYATIMNGSPKGVKEVLRREGFVLEGRHHNGADDAKNIAKIFVKYLGRWKV